MGATRHARRQRLRVQLPLGDSALARSRMRSIGLTLAVTELATNQWRGSRELCVCELGAKTRTTPRVVDMDDDLVSSSGARPLHRPCRSAASRGRPSAVARRSGACSPSRGCPGARGAGHTSRRGRSTGGIVNGRGGAPMQSRKQRRPARHGTFGSPRPQACRRERPDGCIARMMRKPNRTALTAAVALLL